MFNDAAIIQARIDLTAALRWAARLGLNEGVCNHFSLTLPGHADHFLINPQGLHWSEITPTDLVILNGKGEVVASNHQVEPTAFFIHGGIHRGNRKACVLHTHMPYTTALTLLEDGELLWANQNALRFHGRVAYDRGGYGGVALAHEEGDRMCKALGNADVLFLEHHGVVVCGESVAYAFDDLYYLERSCMVQVLAQSTGGKLKMIPEKLRQGVADQIGGERQQSTLHFDALKRIMDREEPGWSTIG
jgi:ribulose-5-phosphate 4-epimerase/fuculose-1-phosphate aldolase